MGRILLLRHGETEWSASGRHTSRSDIPLTERGRRQAVEAGRLLTALLTAEPALALASPRLRARDTADLAGLSTTVDERLVEWDYGQYEGLTTQRIRRSVPGWTVWTHPIPGGETAETVTERVDGLLADCRGLAGDVVLVGHGHFSRVLTARWLGLPATEGVCFALDPASVTVLGEERGHPRLDHVNLPGRFVNLVGGSRPDPAPRPWPTR